MKLNLKNKTTQKILNAFLSLPRLWPEAWGGTVGRRLIYKNFFRKLGNYVSFGDLVTITEPKNIAIGENTVFLQGCFLYGHGNGKISIGKRCSFNSNVLIGASENGTVFIGDNVLIGPNVVIRASLHDYSNIKINIRDQGHRSGFINIEDNVWIGANTVISQNVNIRKGCVVGAGSVVTKDLPSNYLCVGAPARPIKKRK